MKKRERERLGKEENDVCTPEERMWEHLRSEIYKCTTEAVQGLFVYSCNWLPQQMEWRVCLAQGHVLIGCPTRATGGISREKCVCVCVCACVCVRVCVCERKATEALDTHPHTRSLNSPTHSLSLRRSRLPHAYVCKCTGMAHCGHFYSMSQSHPSLTLTVTLHNCISPHPHILLLTLPPPLTLTPTTSQSSSPHTSHPPTFSPTPLRSQPLTPTLV